MDKGKEIIDEMNDVSCLFKNTKTNNIPKGQFAIYGTCDSKGITICGICKEKFINGGLQLQGEYTIAWLQIIICPHCHSENHIKSYH